MIKMIKRLIKANLSIVTRTDMAGSLLFFVSLICIVMYKMVVKKQNIHYNYTSFDTINGPTSAELHEEKSERVVEE